MDDIEDSEEMSDAQKEMMENIMGNVTENLTPGKIRNAAIVNIISCLLTIAGAFMMWNLNQKGFYLYIVGILVMIIGSLMIYDGFMGAIAAGAAGFIGILFIILYGVNLKHMH